MAAVDAAGSRGGAAMHEDAFTARSGYVVVSRVGMTPSPLNPTGYRLLETRVDFDRPRSTCWYGREGAAGDNLGGRARGDKRTVIDGSFVETIELVAGFTILEVRSLEEAIDRVKRRREPGNRESEACPPAER